MLTCLDGGDTWVYQADGTKGLVPNEPFVATLNKFGEAGWEMVQKDAGWETQRHAEFEWTLQHVPDSPRVMFAFKRLATDRPPDGVKVKKIGREDL